MKELFNTYKKFLLGYLMVIIGSGVLFGTVLHLAPDTRGSVPTTLLDWISVCTYGSAIIWTSLLVLFLGLNYMCNGQESKELSENIKNVFKG